MKSKVKEFLFFFALQCLSYGVITWNYRMVAQARYPSIFASDLLCAALGFTAIKRVADAKSHVALAGYMLGGAVGSVVSAWITRKIYGQ